MTLFDQNTNSNIVILLVPAKDCQNITAVNFHDIVKYVNRHTYYHIIPVLQLQYCIYCLPKYLKEKLKSVRIIIIHLTVFNIE